MDTKKIAFGSAALIALLLAAPSGRARAQQAQPLPPGARQPLEFNNEFGSGGYLGVSVAEVTPDTVKQFKLPEESGVLITDVADNTPAAKAGLKNNDVITDYDGMKIEGTAEFRRLVRETPPGREAQLTVWRDGHAEKLAAQVGQVPAGGGNELYGRGPGPGPNFRFAPGFGPGQGQGGPGYRPGGPGYGARQSPSGQGLPETPTIGAAVQNLSGQLGQYFGAPNGQGVLVTEVREGSPAEKSGLKAGDVIVKVDNEQVQNVEELRGRLTEYRNGASVALDVLRRGMEMSLTVMPQQPLPINPGGPRRIPL